MRAIFSLRQLNIKDGITSAYSWTPASLDNWLSLFPWVGAIFMSEGD